MRRRRSTTSLLFSMLGQREKLRELLGLPSNDEQYAKTSAILKQTVGCVLDLRAYFRKYFDSLMESVDALPPEWRKHIKEAVQYRGVALTDHHQNGTLIAITPES